MQKIHFQNLSRNWSQGLLIASALIILLTGYGVIFNYENKWLIILGFLALLAYQSQMLWFKNYVGYNKVGIVIKTHYIKSKSLKFKEIENLDIDGGVLKIKSRDKTIKVEIKNILETDVSKLIEILSEYSNIKLRDHRHSTLPSANFQN